MTPTYADADLEIWIGDARDVLAELEPGSIDAIVTSPPYWQQRSYLPPDDPAKDQEIGLEMALEGWLEAMVEMARLYRRVLRPAGSLWLNLGDKYVAHGGHVARLAELAGRDPNDAFGKGWRLGWPSGVGRKSLTLAPYRLALRLTDQEGWLLRDEVIWHKTNGTPDSAPNRFRRAHEVLFRFTLSREDYFDLASVRTRYKASTLERAERGSQKFGSRKWQKEASSARPRSGKAFVPADGANPGDVWSLATASREGAATDHVAPFPPELVVRPILATVPPGGVVLDPFAGSGTVGVVANTLGRRAILVDLDRRNLDEILRRSLRTLDFYALGMADAESAPAPIDDQAAMFEAVR